MSHDDPGLPPPSLPPVSRRGFLKVIGAGAAVGLGGKAVAGDGDEPAPGMAQVIGPDAAEIEIEINGEKRRVAVEPRDTLLDVLRDRLGLTGCKRVCDRGACGACTVLIDGVPMVSCMHLAVEAAGTSITTIEGIGTPDAMHPLQQAFWEHDAQQCGFCTPGFVTSLSALFARPQPPSEEEIRTAASGHLCRCGTYTRVVEAALAVARKG